jgi:hypothetical protein
MSEPDRGARLCYFADYEVHMSDHLTFWGQTTLVYDVAPGADIDPADVVAQIRQKAADAHGARRGDVRIRCLNRM